MHGSIFMDTHSVANDPQKLNSTSTKTVKFLQYCVYPSNIY